MIAGRADIARAASELAARLPEPLAPLAELAYNYRWCWTPSATSLLSRLDPHRWQLVGGNPVRMLSELSPEILAGAAGDRDYVAAAGAEVAALRDDLARDHNGSPIDPARPVAFLCTEFAVHRSLPIYAGGLGVLAGDLLKEASDRALPVVGVGLLYRQGYFHQRMDTSGWQHEYWVDHDPDLLPAALVTGEDGRPVTVSVPIRGRNVVTQIWRVDVGRTPLFLLDAHRPDNHPIDRWITSRLYIGERRFRLAQYALIGVGGVRALRALGIDPHLIHMNEGHVSMAAVESMREHLREGAGFDEALERVRHTYAFTTHTPVAAGNEAYTPGEILDTLRDLPETFGDNLQPLLGLGRARADDHDEPLGLTAFGLRVSRASNGVSRRHGEVARSMWQHLYPGRDAGDVPISHVTNGVHMPTWTARPMQELLAKHLGPDWAARATEPDAWAAIEDIPDEEIWRVRRELRTALIAYVRERAAADRLGRGEPIEYAEAATRALSEDTLTLGFARRATAYKRIYLLNFDPERALRLLEDPHPIQLLLAGKPHPADEEGKRLVQTLFGLRWAPHVAERVAFLEDYHLGMAERLVAGCDVWVNTPRPPLEACGTSGMKAAMNGSLNLSVLDGWWEEAYDGSNGWAIVSPVGSDAHAQDAHDAGALYDLLEREVVPLFYDRDSSGIPRGWIARIKASLRSIGPQYSAGRMLRDYARDVYAEAQPAGRTAGS